MQFGYLEKSNIETGNLRTIEELEQAVRSLQVSLLNVGYVKSQHRNYF